VGIFLNHPNIIQFQHHVFIRIFIEGRRHKRVKRHVVAWYIRVTTANKFPTVSTDLFNKGYTSVTITSETIARQRNSFCNNSIINQNRVAREPSIDALARGEPNKNGTPGTIVAPQRNQAQVRGANSLYDMRTDNHIA